MVFSHINGVLVTAEFSDCGRYRYRLTIIKPEASGNETACVIMQNPSVANSEIADKSVQFIERLIFEKDYPQFKNISKVIIVNQFAFIQTKHFSGEERHIGPANDQTIHEAISASDIIVVAWGSSNAYKERQATINAMISTFPTKMLFKTKTHPSRGSYHDFIEPYRI